MNLTQNSKLLFPVFLALLIMVSTAQAGEIVTDTFGRVDGSTSNDSIGDAESPASTYHWSEGFVTWDDLGDAARITGGKFELLSGSFTGRQGTLNTNSADIIATTDLDYILGDSGGNIGTGPNYQSMVLLRRNYVLAAGNTAGTMTWKQPGTIGIQFSPTGYMFVWEIIDASQTDTLYSGNPWGGSASDSTYGAAGSLPVSIDPNLDGRIGKIFGGTNSFEPLTLSADLQGTALSVSINGDEIWAGSTTFTTSASGDNFFSLASEKANRTTAAGISTVQYDNVNLDLVPEPATLSMLLIGGVMGLLRRRK